MKKLFFVLAVLFCTTGVMAQGNLSKYLPVEPKKSKFDDNMQGIYKLTEDTDSHNYFVIEKITEYEYSISYMNRSGNNRGLEHFRMVIREFDGMKFLCVQNWLAGSDNWTFFRIRDKAENYWNITMDIVMEETLQNAKDGKELTAMMLKHVNDPSFFGKEYHFMKKLTLGGLRPVITQ